MNKTPKNTSQISLRSFDKDDKPKEAAKSRREYIEKETGINTSIFENCDLDPAIVFGKNIENMVGSVTIPLGVAGPILVKGENVTGRHYLPCATTEGALVASISRGCKVTSIAGVSTAVSYRGMTRAPLFECESLKDVDAIKKLITDKYESMVALATATSSHLKFASVDVFNLGKYVWVRCVFDTDEAMGMNMVTIASEKVAEYISDKIPSCELLSLSGNMCVDKKANWLNIIAGRGYDVTAEAVISDKTLQKYFGVNAEAIAKVCRTKNWYGGAMSGSMSFNAHSANVVAAIFLATGQDAAHIIESSQAFTIAEATEEGLYIAVKLPNIIAGSIGGGTGLPSQKAAMDIMLTDVDNPTKIIDDHKTYAFAEVTAAGVLAGELSLLAALSTNTLASAHVKHARGSSKK